MNLRLSHRHRRSRRACQGMVLFEVIIALVIFTMVAFSLVMALDSSFDATTDRNEVDIAIRGLNNQVALLHTSRVLPGTTNAPDDGSGVIYNIAVTQEQMQDQKMQPVLNMYRATITATWTSRGQTQERDVSELIYQP